MAAPEQKSRVEQKGKSPLDFDFQCEYKHESVPIDPLVPRNSRLEVPEKLPQDNWLVAAKRS